MRTYRGDWPVTLPAAPVVTIGNFDGAHLGHQAIFHQVRRRARELNGTSVILTFQPHPRRWFKPDAPPFLLGSEEETVRLIEASGIDLLVIACFDAGFAAQTPEQFVDDILVRRLGARVVFVGYDFNFGHNRAGNYETLKALAKPHGIEVDLIEEVLYDGVTISSSRIRKLVAAGEVEKARELLGRTHRISGPVVEGAKLGSQLGFPTANVDYGSDRLLPANGVYAAWAHLGDRRWPAAVNIGVRPTANLSARPVLEAHLLGYDGASLYGRALELRFLQRLRGEEKFESVEALRRQIAADVMTVKEICGSRAPNAA